MDVLSDIESDRWQRDREAPRTGLGAIAREIERVTASIRAWYDPSPYYGFSVQAAAGLTIEQLASDRTNRSIQRGRPFDPMSFRR